MVLSPLREEALLPYMREVNKVLSKEEYKSKCYFCHSFPYPFIRCPKCKTGCCLSELEEWRLKRDCCPNLDYDSHTPAYMRDDDPESYCKIEPVEFEVLDTSSY